MKTLHVLLNVCCFQLRLPGIGEYNAVWDDKLGICYKLLKCTCDCIIGASIQSANDASQSIVGKVSKKCNSMVIKCVTNCSL